jgi:hypothetical protein
MPPAKPRPPEAALRLACAFWAKLGAPFVPEEPAGARAREQVCEASRRAIDVVYFDQDVVTWRDGGRAVQYASWFFCEKCVRYVCDGECGNADAGAYLSAGPLPGGGSLEARRLDLSDGGVVGGPDALWSVWLTCLAEDEGAGGGRTPD